MPYEAKRSADEWFPVRLVDAGDLVTPETGIVYGDLTVVYGGEAAESESSYSVASADWKEQGSGNYWLRMGADEFTSEGRYIVDVTASGCASYGFVVEVRDEKVSGILDTIESLDGQASAAIETHRLDELMAAALDGEPAAGSMFGDLTEDDSGTQRFTSNALEQTGVSSGAHAETVTVRDTADNPVADADVWITSDEAGKSVVEGTYQTNSSGEVTFHVDYGPTYYIWAQKDGVNFDNPRSWTPSE
ncbi:MAG: Ig-like domain-containing protein [Planctomycetota bacterium]